VHLQPRGTLDMIAIREVHVVVMADAKRPLIQQTQPKKSHRSEVKIEKLQSDGAEHEEVSVSIGALQHAQPPMVLRIHLSLSHREVQIHDGLVTGMPIKEASALATSARRRSRPY
jgi:hypothetical protein